MNYKETAVLYLVCVLTFILSGFLLFSKNISRRLYLLTIIAILCIEGAYIGIRWFDTGHPPIFGTFEATLCASWMLILFSVLIDRKAQFARIVIPIAALTLFYGLNFDKTGKPLVISEQSYWVYFHALFAWIAYGFYIFSFAGAVTILVNQTTPTHLFTKEGERGGVDLFTYQTLLWGFFAQTIMFALGSYYSIRLHGSWWVWDPVEYLFAVSWCLYAIPIHGRILYGWGPQRIAWLILLGMVGTILFYWGLIYFPWATYHIFDTELKIH